VTAITPPCDAPAPSHPFPAVVEYFVNSAVRWLTGTIARHKFGKPQKSQPECIQLMEELLSFSDASLRAQLGPLEQKVLDMVSSLRTATVREIVREGKLWQTYPTIMTTMDRLFKKGLLTRVPEGRAFRYSPRYSPEELERAEAIGGIRRFLSSQNVSLHLSYLVEAVSAQDARLLDELHSLVEQQRVSLRKEKP